MGEFDAITDEDFRKLDAEGFVMIEATESTADALRAALRKVAREQGWKIRTGFVPERGFVWADRPDFQTQTRAPHEDATDRIAGLIFGRQELNGR